MLKAGKGFERAYAPSGTLDLSANKEIQALSIDAGSVERNSFTRLELDLGCCCAAAV